VEEKENIPGMPTIQEVNDVIVGELAERGEWVVANIQTSSFWPVKAQKVLYRGEIIWILPLMKNYFPAIAMKVRPEKGRRGMQAVVDAFS
jgi:hypothetical protein